VSKVKSGPEIDPFRSRLTTPLLSTTTDKMACSRIAYYVAMGQEQELQAPSTIEGILFFLHTTH
jgi:hypothetical protein